jgi:hypothetical protein
MFQSRPFGGPEIASSMGHNKRLFHRVFSSDALWEYHAVKIAFWRSFLFLFFVVSAIASKIRKTRVPTEEISICSREGVMTPSAIYSIKYV